MTRFVASFEEDPDGLQLTVRVNRTRQLQEVSRTLGICGFDLEAEVIEREIATHPKHTLAPAESTQAKLAAADDATLDRRRRQAVIDAIVACIGAKPMSLLNNAQAALGVMLIEREACDLERVHGARFAGPARSLGSETRPSLIIDEGNREADKRIVESEGDNVFSRLVDAFYTAATTARGREPFWLFEKKDGLQKAPCSVSLAISNFTAAAGARMPPTVPAQTSAARKRRGHRCSALAAERPSSRGRMPPRDCKSRRSPAPPDRRTIALPSASA